MKRLDALAVPLCLLDDRAWRVLLSLNFIADSGGAVDFASLGVLSARIYGDSGRAGELSAALDSLASSSAGGPWIRRTENRIELLAKTKNKPAARAVQASIAVVATSDLTERQKRIVAALESLPGAPKVWPEIEAFARRLELARPDVEIEREVNAAGLWLQSNPSHAKSNLARFVSNWILRCRPSDAAAPTEDEAEAESLPPLVEAAALHPRVAALSKRAEFLGPNLAALAGIGQFATNEGKETDGR